MSDAAIRVSDIIGETRGAVEDIVRAGQEQEARGLGLSTAVAAAGGAIDEAVREACDVDLVALLIDGWSKAAELGGYADSAKYPPDKPVRVILGRHPMTVTIDPELRLQALPLVNWPLKFVIVLTATVEAAVLRVIGGAITRVDLGALRLAAELRWGATKVPLPLKTREIAIPGSFPIEPPVALRRA